MPLISATPHVPPEGRRPGSKQASSWIPLFLILAVFAAYAGVSGCGFIQLDDSSHVYENPVIARGLTIEGVGTAFTTPHAKLYVPLTVISFMADVSIFRGSPVAMHLENLFWHALTTVLLFVTLRRLTGEIWPSAFAAALFGLHPINVESVVWITERKNVLCAFFSIATLNLWARYVTRPSAIMWMSAVGAFGLALLAKPMAVTLPFALLLFDVWPLDRWQRTPGWKLVMEKLPLFVLSFASSRLSVWAAGTSLATFEELPFLARVTAALVTMRQYLESLFFPVEFALLYPHPVVVQWVPAAISLSILVTITVVAWLLRRSCPWLIVCWLFFCGMLVPSLGLVQMGSQCRADRFTYLAQIGIWIIVAWSAARYWPPRFSIARAGTAIVVLLGLLGLTIRQVEYWRDSVILFQHSLSVTGPNRKIFDLLAVAYYKRNERQKAIGYWLKGIEYAPAARIWLAIGATFDELDDRVRAHEAYRQAVKLEPENMLALAALASAEDRSGNLEEARKIYLRILKMDPTNEDVRARLELKPGEKDGSPNATKQP